MTMLKDHQNIMLYLNFGLILWTWDEQEMEDGSQHKVYSKSGAGCSEVQPGRPSTGVLSCYKTTQMNLRKSKLILLFESANDVIPVEGGSSLLF
jgi:hypothetical protein